MNLGFLLKSKAPCAPSCLESCFHWFIELDLTGHLGIIKRISSSFCYEIIKLVGAGVKIVSINVPGLLAVKWSY